MTISMGGMIWTDAEETQGMYQLLKEREGDVVAPVCQYCKKPTCYILEEADIIRDPKTGKVKNFWPKKRGVRDIMFALKPAAFFGDEVICFPVFQCHGCAAAWDGRQYAEQGQDPKQYEAELVTKPLLEQERKEAKAAFWRSYDKHSNRILDEKQARAQAEAHSKKPQSKAYSPEKSRMEQAWRQLG